MPSGPKTNKFVNRHAREANARSAEQSAAAAAAAAAAAEDALWADDGDKSSRRKAERAADRDAKAAEKTERKAENRELFETETKQARKGGAMAEFRRAQEEIAREAKRDADERKKAAELERESANQKPATVSAVDSSILVKKRGGADDDDDDDGPKVDAKASKAAQAKQLSELVAANDPTSDEFRRKMGRRAKVLYKQFVSDNMAVVKADSPSQKRSQHLDTLWKMWQTDPQNPFVQRKEAQTSDAAAKERSWMENSDDDAE